MMPEAAKENRLTARLRLLKQSFHRQAAEECSSGHHWTWSHDKRAVLKPEHNSCPD